MRFITPLAIMLLMSASSALAKEQTVTLDVEQMDCALCKVTVQKALMKVNGVMSADVSWEEKTAVVVFDDEVANVSTLTEATTNAGYPSKEREGSQADG